jgi:pimeloyl-ACP methyl ester carboxylesterase
LHGIRRDTRLLRSGSRVGVFDEGPQGSLKAPSTIVWGLDDLALDSRICVDGLAEYLPHHSQVVILPHGGHFTPMQRDSRILLEKVILWALGDAENNKLSAALQASESEAKITVQT